MKYHIVSPYDTLDKIINVYAISVKDLKESNPNVDLFSLKVGDKLIIKKSGNSSVPTEEFDKNQMEEYQKYICPHCKNVILVPK